VLDEGFVIAVVAREVGESGDALAVVGVERNRPIEPQLRGARIGQMLPLGFTCLHRDVGLALGFGRQFEPALLQVCEQSPILVGLGLAGHGFERREIVGVVRQRAPVEFGTQSDISQRVFGEARPGHQRDGAGGSAQQLDDLIPGVRRAGDLAGRCVCPSRSFERVDLRGVFVECALEHRDRLVAIAELFQPDRTHLGQQGGPLVGSHRQRTLDLADLNRDVPLILAGVQFSQPHQRGAVLRVDLQRLAVAGDRSIGLAEALVVDSADPAVNRRQFARLVGNTRGAQPVFVDLDDAGPVAGEEQLLLQRLEGLRVVRIGEKPFTLAIEQGRQGFS
jgi:hypothetical protein